MIQEYLFISKEHKEEIKTYSYEQVKTEIYDIENSDCWILTFSCSNENENNAKKLSNVNNYITDNYHPIILSSGCSSYYNRKLYPCFNEFERKLRKLLYLKSALSQNSKDAETIKDLESKDFGEIFTLLFSDVQFVQNVRKSVNDKSWQFTKAEILSTLDNIQETTVWDRLIGENSVPLLRSDFIKVKAFRNDVMHAHSMDTSTYKSALNLIKTINNQLDTEIGKIIGEKEDALEIDNEKDFNVAIADAIKDMNAVKENKSLQEQVAELQSSISTIKTDGMVSALEKYQHIVTHPDIVAATEFMSSPAFASIQQWVKEIEKIKIDIPPALAELQKTLNSLKPYNITVPSEVISLYQSLQAFKLDPALTDIINKFNTTKEYEDNK